MSERMTLHVLAVVNASPRDRRELCASPKQP